MYVSYLSAHFMFDIENDDSCYAFYIKCTIFLFQLFSIHSKYLFKVWLFVQISFARF